MSMLSHYHSKTCLFFTGVLIFLLSTPLIANNPRDKIDFYIESYGRIEPTEDPRVNLAHQIFHQIRRVAGGRHQNLAQLEVVDSPHDPWAISLSDGHVVLSKGAIDICYKLENSNEACLAFVLGHEIAHIANNDFWHHRVSRFLSAHSNKTNVPGQIRGTENELKADDNGFIYAAMAGYSVEKLLLSNSHGKDFFHYWSKQTSASAQHQVLEVRANLLRERLIQIKDELSYFQFGVRLAHFDYCDDAVHFFSAFQTIFPGRETLNNLGYCYLQIARQTMNPARAYFYWLPQQLDGETRAAALTQRGIKNTSRLIEFPTGAEQKSLSKAIAYLKQAVASDPYYIAARLNLAVAYLYNNQPHHARVVVDEAHLLAPDNIDISALQALSIYEQGNEKFNYLPDAIVQLEALSKKKPASHSVIYNLSRLLKIAGENQKAAIYLEQLDSNKQQLPKAISAILCEEWATSSSKCAFQNRSLPPEKSLPWPLPIQKWQQITPESKRILSQWEKKQFNWGTNSLEGAIYSSQHNNAEAIVIDNFIQMQVLKLQKPLSHKKIQSHCQQPLQKRQLPVGEVWSCGQWAALSLNDHVNELWWIAQ